MKTKGKLRTLSGSELAPPRREAQKNGTMLDFKLRFFPPCKHSA